MQFEWDDLKNRANVAKHGISFETASGIFEGPFITAQDTRGAYGEARMSRRLPSSWSPTPTAKA